MTTLALKTQIEQFFATQIAAYAGVGGANLDPDLTSAQQLKLSQWGFGVLPQDRAKGPLAKTVITNCVPIPGNEGGQGTLNRTIIANATLIVEGITQQYTDPQLAAVDRDMIEAVIRLDLLKLPRIPVSSNFTSGGKSETLEILDWQGSTWDYVDNTNNTPGPVIGSPVADGGNTSTGTFTDDTTAAYTYSSDLVYTVEVVTGNTTPGNLAGLTFRWKAGSGSFSSPIAATGLLQSLSNGVSVKFAVATGQSFVANDSWSISAYVKGMSYIGKFTQQWRTTVQLTSGT